MSHEKERLLAQEVIRKDKWWDTFSRFIDVLRLNIYIVDRDGVMIVPPEEGKYGGKLLLDSNLKFDLLKISHEFESQFEEIEGKFFEANNNYGLRNYAIPIEMHNGERIAYVMVGPVVINKRLATSEYEKMAKDYGANVQEVLDELNDLRVVTNIMMNSILNLLGEIIRDNVKSSVKEYLKNHTHIDPKKNTLSQEVSQVVDEVNSTVRIDELLGTLLDVALKMTETESGSIMMVDQEALDMSIKVSRGLNQDRIPQARIKVGEGIAGIAVQENSYFLIDGQEADNRIQPFLKRPDIKHSLVMPLIVRGKVFGVLNLHTRQEENKIKDNLGNLRYLSKLLSSAV